MDVAAETETNVRRRSLWLLLRCWRRRSLAAGASIRNFARSDLVSYQFLAGGLGHRPCESLETRLRGRSGPAHTVDGRKDAPLKGASGIAKPNSWRGAAL